jgi:hypothetical protein
MGEQVLPITSPMVSPGDRIAASAVIASDPHGVFAFLAEMHNHWTLAGRSLQLLEIGQAPDGSPYGEVEMRGPLGIRRRVRTRVLGVREPAYLWGTAEVGGRTVTRVRWDLQPVRPGHTRVTLSAVVCTAGWVDRLLLAGGGRIWLRRVFAGTVQLLARRLEERPLRPALEAA